MNPPPTEERNIGSEELYANATLLKECDQNKDTDMTLIPCYELKRTPVSSLVLGFSEEATSVNLGCNSLINIGAACPILNLAALSLNIQNWQSSTERSPSADPLDLVTCENDLHGDPNQIVDSTRSSELAPITEILIFDVNSSNSNIFKDTSKQAILTERNKCDFCGKSFRFKSYLRRHEIKHIVGKTFRCSICGQTFHRELDLSMHARVHTVTVGNSPHKRDIPGKTFKQERTLKKQVMIQTGEKFYKCDVCAKWFISESILKTHTMIHTGESPFKCDFCEKSFSSKSKLKTHTRTHTGEKPYECEVCDRPFNTKSDLNRHAKIHTGEEPYKCKVCGRTFKQKVNLKCHTRLHIPENH